jgi:hypothetical protein
MSDSQTAESFLTYRHYIRALARLAGYHHPMVATGSVYPELATRFAALPTLAPLQVPLDRDAVKRSLMNAWGTELLMAVTSRYSANDELMRLTNNWTAVQLYYVFYHATQALVIARGRPRPESHPITRRLFLDMWASRPLDCTPWSLGYQTAPQNVPAGHTVNSQITTVARPRSDADCVDYVLKALYTTRNEDLPAARAAAREEKRGARKRAWTEEETQRQRRGLRARKLPRFALPTLTPDEKTRVRTRQRCYTVMDLLWRLRIKTHYQDGLMMLEGPADDSVSAEFNRDMQHVAGSTMMLFEMHLCRQLGRDVLKEMAEEWLQRNQASVTAGLGERLPVIFV